MKYFSEIPVCLVIIVLKRALTKKDVFKLMIKRRCLIKCTSHVINAFKFLYEVYNYKTKVYIPANPVQ